MIFLFPTINNNQFFTLNFEPMKTLIQNKLPMSICIAVLALFVMSLCTNCKKVELEPKKAPDSAVTIDLIGLKSDSGFAYKLSYDFPIPGDSQTAPTQSTLRIFENGVELGPAHSNHNDIRKYGLGQFSHWGNEIIFSSSDNTNPLSNGRKYSYKTN
jgi:hypothetical protein